MYKAGDLVMVPVPFSDLSATKRRPVLILTTPDAQDDFVACPITSRSGWPNARPLVQEHLLDGALPLVSWVRSDKVLTLNVSLVRRRFGGVTDAFRSAIAGEVCRLIDGVPDSP